MTSSSAALPLGDHHRFKMNPLPSVSSLISPPEPKPLDSFTPHASSQDSPCNNDIKLPPISADRKRTQSEMDLPSPPVTPHAGHKKRKSNASSEHIEHIESDSVVNASRDPVLFSHRDSAAGVVTDEPLFGPAQPPTREALVDRHINSHMAMFDSKTNKPTREEYHLALSCVPVVSKQYNRNPGAWAVQERETLERQMALMNRPHAATSGTKLKKLAPGPAKKGANAQPRMQRPGRVKRTPRSTPKQKPFDSFDVSPSSTTTTTAAAAAAAAYKTPRALGTNRDDTDFNSLEDFSPPLNTLGGNAKALKADWKGQMLDLTSDPDRHLLNSAELNLAATLRLSCATYLCSKRRIFEARLRALNVGKEFRKTDAQQACKIDVNKASKLWTAYDRVGWFKPEHFQQYQTTSA